MKTDPYKRYIQSNPNSLFYSRSRGLDYEKEVAYKKISDLVNENIKLKNELNNQERRVNELQKHNNKIVSIIAHDLRSPYNAVMSVLDIIRMSAPDMDKQTLSSYLNIINETTNSSLELLDELLGWAVLNNNSGSFNPERINLYQISMKVVDKLSPLAELKEIKLINNIADNINIIADPNMLEAIFRNILSNSIQYNVKGGTVALSAANLNSVTEIEIKDTGKGINKEYLKKLLSNSTSDETSETQLERWKGLGLLFCKEFVERHNGNLSIESEEGKGTSVRFSLNSKSF